MSSSNNNIKQTGPLLNLFENVKKILEFMEVKDSRQAESYETSESRDTSTMWINAKIESDSYTSYQSFWTVSMFQDVIPNARLKDITYFMEHPNNVPLKFRDHLLIKGREAFLASYEEKNNYYRMLNGLPDYGTPSSEFIYLSESIRSQLHAPNQPIHLLSPLIQNNFMNTTEYQEILSDNPDKLYLKYLGMYKIDIFTARKANDFDIIRYPLHNSGINPNLVDAFAELYDSYREYVMVVLYNEQFEDLYTNYRSFMKVLIESFVLMQISNKALESINNREYLDDSILHILLSSYDIPDTLLLTNDIRRKLAVNLLKLVREKGTNSIYYDLVDILGYQDIVVSKLMIMKGQKFHKDDNYKADTDDSNNEPYFVQLNVKNDDPYKAITSKDGQSYDYHSIVDNDPTWWDLPETRDILKKSNYSIMDSKYITIEAVIHQIKYLFESIYFTRMILDNKKTTDNFNISIPEIFGAKQISIYDLMVFVISATCMSTGLSGKISSDTDLLATAGFNFDIDLDTFVEYVNNTKYIEKDRVLKFVEKLSVTDPSDLNRIFNDVMYPMREWLEAKISASENRKEMVEYENIYRSLYTYDISRNTFLEDFEIPMETIRKKYNLKEEDILAFQHFYPRSISGSAITVDQYNESYNETRYKYPFINRINRVDWNIHIVIDTPQGSDDRGYVYFHDILNSPDLRTLTNPNGTRVFMDWEDEDIGWEVNTKAVNKALELISGLSEDTLNKAFFQVDTHVLNSNGKKYAADEMLPDNIRTGIYRDILKDKITMDMNGLAVPPETYIEYLYRKNPDLYNLLVANNRFETDRESWYEDVMRIVLAVETALDMHMKYFEQSIAGSELFFKPLVTLINHFKSTYVNIVKTSIRHIFDDRMDTGGNSNMFKLFDEIQFVIHFVTLQNRGFDSQFGLFDTEYQVKHKILMKDRSEIYKMTSSGFDASVRTESFGSIHMVDEVKFFKNGKPIDPDGQPSSWYSGEPGTGRWSEEDDIIMKSREKAARVRNLPIDFDGWKEFVESYG